MSTTPSISYTRYGFFPIYMQKKVIILSSYETLPYIFFDECWSNSSSFLFEVLRQIYICLRFSDPKVVSRNMQVNWNTRINLMQCKEHLPWKDLLYTESTKLIEKTYSCQSTAAASLQPLVNAKRFHWPHYLFQKLQKIKAFHELDPSFSSLLHMLPLSFHRHCHGSSRAMNWGTFTESPLAMISADQSLMMASK